MKYQIESKVNIMGMWMTHAHQQVFDDDSNVFGRILEYHKYMYQAFPKCEFRLVSAEQIKEGE